MFETWMHITQTTKHFTKRHLAEIGLVALGVILAATLVLPESAFADTLTQTTAERKTLELRVDTMINQTRSHGDLPVAELGSPRFTVNMPVSAYTSRPQETDDTPFIMASGNLVYDGAVATNYLPLGTKVRIPDIYGDKVFIVEDRMNRRYDKRMDIWMEDLDDARQHGVQYLEIEVF